MALGETERPGPIRPGGEVSERMFERLLDAIPDAVIIAGGEGKIIFLNQQAEALFGWKQSELLGKPVELLLPERYRGRHVGHRAAYMDSPRVRPMGAGLELFALHADGREIPVEISLSPTTVDGAVAVISTVRDVSDRKALERELERLLEREQAVSASLRAIQSVTDVALGELETDALLIHLLGRVRAALAADTAAVLLVDERGENLVARAVLGLEEKVEQGMQIPLGAGFTGRIAATRRAVIVEDVDEADIVNPLLRTTGVRSLLGIPLVVEGGLLGVLHVGSLRPRRFSDADAELLQLVGDRVALALDRARLFDEAQEAVRLRNEFLSAISHDLGNPVAAIRMQSRLLRENVATEQDSASDLLEGLAQIEATARLAWSLIEELMDLARAQVGRSLELNWQKMDLAATVRDTVAAHQATREPHQIRLDLEIPELVGEWDATRVERVITNLLSNAIKYSPAGGEILVTLREEPRSGAPGTWAVLGIADRGIGIPAADLPRIFERFRRAGNVQGRFPGTGIGLAGAREIVEHHGGTLTVESQEGAGTTVTMRLPREEMPPDP